MKPTSFENHVFQTQDLGKSKAPAEGCRSANPHPRTTRLSAPSHPRRLRLKTGISFFPRDRISFGKVPILAV
jgi:hypothetical protein